MIQLNPIAQEDLCSRPAPHRILERVAGIAFNFSSTDLHMPLPDLAVATSAKILRPSR